MLQYIILLFFFLKLASSNKTQVDLAFNGKHKLDGLAHLNSDGRFMPKNSSTRMMGHAFYNFPIQCKNHTNGSVLSFSTTFIFAVEPDYPKLGGHGIAFVISPSKDLKGAMPSQYLGLFNSTNDGYGSNHVVAVELDAIPDLEFNDINGNHVGVDINSLKSVISALAGYYTGKNGGFKNLTLKSEDPMQVWVEYDGTEKKLNVTLSPDVAYIQVNAIIKIISH